MLMLLKSLSTNFSFTGNMGTDNEKQRVSYSRLSTQDKDIDKDVEQSINSSDFYKTPSKSFHQVSRSNNSNNNNNNEPEPIMKHSVSMDWKMGTILNTASSQKSSSSGLRLSWRKKESRLNEELPSPSPALKKEEDLFQKVQSHSKFLSSVIFNDENCTDSDLDDEDDEDPGFTCDVCDRSFPTPKRLSAHQDRKRHFGCIQCDSIFPSRENLECHREQSGHYDFAGGSDCGGSSDTTFESDEEDLLDDVDDDPRLGPGHGNVGLNSFV